MNDCDGHFMTIEGIQLKSPINGHMPANSPSNHFGEMTLFLLIKVNWFHCNGGSNTSVLGPLFILRNNGGLHPIMLTFNPTFQVHLVLDLCLDCVLPYVDVQCLVIAVYKNFLPWL